MSNAPNNPAKHGRDPDSKSQSGERTPGQRGFNDAAEESLEREEA